MRALLVDDDRELARLLRDYLGEAGRKSWPGESAGGATGTGSGPGADGGREGTAGTESEPGAESRGGAEVGFELPASPAPR